LCAPWAGHINPPRRIMRDNLNGRIDGFGPALVLNIMYVSAA
jgi:hypothetical protein